MTSSEWTPRQVKSVVDFHRSVARACGTAKTPPPRHQDAPCDERGRRVEIADREGDLVAFRYPGEPDGLYMGDLDPREGVVRSPVEATRRQVRDAFRRLRRARKT